MRVFAIVRDSSHSSAPKVMFSKMDLSLSEIPDFFGRDPFLSQSLNSFDFLRCCYQYFFFQMHDFVPKYSILRRKTIIIEATHLKGLKETWIGHLRSHKFKRRQHVSIAHHHTYIIPYLPPFQTDDLTYTTGRSFLLEPCFDYKIPTKLQDR